MRDSLFRKFMVATILAMTVLLGTTGLAMAAAPVAMNDTATVRVGQTLFAPSVLLNDIDADGDTLTASVETMPTHGDLVFDITDGTYAYTPSEGFFGADTFTYRVSDGLGGTHTAAVSITVIGDMWVSEQGSDTTGNGTQTSPFATVPHAMSIIVPGHTIHVGEGTFVCVNLSVKDDVSIEGSGSSMTTLSANGTGGVLRFWGTGMGETLSGVTITGGNSAQGGGILVMANAAPVIRDCIITSNYADKLSGGGGVCVDGPGAAPEFINCTISGNSAYMGGGGVSAVYSATPTFTDCTISNNTAGWMGAGLYARYTAAPIIAGSTISGNVVPGSGTGGGIYAADLAAPVVTDSVIGSNVSALGAGVYALNSAAPVVTDSLITRNTGSRGAGFYATGGGAPFITGCTIAGNKAADGGGVYTFLGGRPRLVNSIVWGNGARDVGGDEQVAATYSCIRRGNPGIGNTASDPLFVNYASGDFRVSGGSPAIDTADAIAASADDLVDVARPQGEGVDMGAYEYLFTARVANPDEIQMSEDSLATLNVLANDAPSESTLNQRTAVQFSTPAVGTLVTSPSGDVTYTPPADWNGTATFTYVADYETTQAAATTVTIRVEPVNDLPVAADDSAKTTEDTSVTIDVLANDEDREGDRMGIHVFAGPLHGNLSFAEVPGKALYTPDPNFFGTDSFSYRAYDSTGYSNVVRVSIEVTPVNDAPDAIDDLATVERGDSVKLDVLGNDTDPEGDSLVARKLDGEIEHGTLTFAADGKLTYKAESKFEGSVTFEYVASDGQLDSKPATVTIVVGPYTGEMIGADDSVVATEDIDAAFDVSANDLVPEGEWRYKVADKPSHGTVSMDAAGMTTYIPAKDFNGSDSFSYRVSSASGSSAEVFVRLTVTPVNDAPVAVADKASTKTGRGVTIDLLANDDDVDGDLLNAIQEVQPAHGALVWSEDGRVRYTPDPGFEGKDFFTYHATDRLLDSGAVRVEVDVAAADSGGTDDDGDSPGDGGTKPDHRVIARGDSGTTNAGSQVSLDVLDNDSDTSGHQMSARIADSPSHGTLELNSDGHAIYTPDAEFVGSDSFTYTASDAFGVSDSASVTIEVTEREGDPGAEDPTESDEPSESITPSVSAEASVTSALNEKPAGENDAFLRFFKKNGTAEKLFGPDGFLPFTPISCTSIALLAILGLLFLRMLARRKKREDEE